MVNISATFVDGVFRPDTVPDVAEGSRVQLTIEPIIERPTGAAALEALFARLREHPIDAGGLHFTRDELNERR